MLWKKKKIIQKQNENNNTGKIKKKTVQKDDVDAMKKIYM